MNQNLQGNQNILRYSDNFRFFGGKAERKDRNGNIKQRVKHRKANQKKEGSVVFASNAGVQPFTVMIKVLYALVTGSAMFWRG